MKVQIITLGGVTLPTESRSMSGFGSTIISTSGRSADGTLHEDFVARKQNWTVAYKTIKKSTKTLLDGIESAQVNNATFPTLTYTDENDIPQTFTVRMKLGSYGALIPQNIFYHSGITITMEEV